MDPLEGPPARTLTGGEVPLFAFTVPDELLKEAVAKSRDADAVADVRDNLRIGEQSFRRDTARAAAALDDALGLFPELTAHVNQPAGTLSGGEQQMLSLARVMTTEPRLLMIDELAFGLAPMTVERLMEIVRRLNSEGMTIILVEQSVNRAMSLARHVFFLERGEIRFDGPAEELLGRSDLRRPVFLAGAPGVESTD